MSHGSFPPEQGLYDPRNEHDACGVGFIVNIKGHKNHKIITQGLEILKNITHRGAVGADPLAGDGAGILIQIPDAFFREVCDINLPPAGHYAVGMLFLPRDATMRKTCEKLMSQVIVDEGQILLGWRDVPTDNTSFSEGIKATEPVIRQVFVGRGDNCSDQDAFERKLFVIRKVSVNSICSQLKINLTEFYVPSFSSRTLLYKGMLLANQVGMFYLDLQDERMETALALVHQRFSTNTFPTWDLAQPFRMICHNGEINTLRGNINWMAARKHSMSSELLGDDLEKLWPLIMDERSDSACFDNALELLVAGGYSLGKAMMLLIPEAWSNNALMDDKLRAFYEYHAALMEPWDGPAAVAFTDGRQIGATLDRNGLRPARYLITKDDMVIMASEMGVLDIPKEKILKKWRLQPGKMFLIDTEQGRIIDDAELKADLANSAPYQEWLAQTQIILEKLPPEVSAMPPNPKRLLQLQQAFGYTKEDLKFFLKPMVMSGQDPISSMGTDISLAVLSNRSRLLYDYFKQNFAQVTNPPIDPIREEIVMSLVSLIGPRPNLLGLDKEPLCKRLEVHQPILSNTDLEKIRRIESRSNGAFRTKTISICYQHDSQAAYTHKEMATALTHLCQKVEEAVLAGNNILILSDRQINADHIAIPALLATSAVHHHLILKGLRTSSGLVVETGEAREVQHFCLLAAYGAEAINPYLAFDTLFSMRDSLELSEKDIQTRYIKAIDKGILKVMSKMGISTYQSYCGAQIFDAVGLSDELLNQYFTGTQCKTSGIGLAEIAEETLQKHNFAYKTTHQDLEEGGEQAYRSNGEHHAWTPKTITKLQQATRRNDRRLYDEFAREINEQNERLLTLRGLFEFKFSDNPIPLDDVEPASDIVKRFATGAMSYGSISYEAHSTIAIAMNRMGAKSNTGEGGEESERFQTLPNGDSKRSAIKQVASGRFGVTTEYLVNADDIQIKMAQGAKP
ncbi:MAG: glutamate synthase subunit alpha, partial [Thiomargarita sp.]|nr:glutamate synthase subunit alpha [Thiomargarita sp.]